MDKTNVEPSNLITATAAVSYMNQALAELMEFDPRLKVIASLSNGIFIIQPSMDKLEFNEKLLKGKPVFTRHVNTIDYVLSVDHEEPGILPAILQTVEWYEGEIAQGDKVGVQIRKGRGEHSFDTMDIKNKIDEIITVHFHASPEIKEPSHVISILVDQDKCYIGLSEVNRNISSWSGGMVHYRKEDADISRAKFKLMEAAVVFSIDMSKFGTAIDLGAAPGGWTSVLLEKGLRVTAVDTGDMDERLLKNKRLNFVKKNAADLDFEPGSFDLLTSDVSWNPINTAKMVNRASQYLKSGGEAVVTVKLMGDKVRKTIREVVKIYEDNFELLGARQLFHNRDEVTLHMKKR